MYRYTIYSLDLLRHSLSTDCTLSIKHPTPHPTKGRLDNKNHTWRGVGGSLSNFVCFIHPSPNVSTNEFSIRLLNHYPLCIYSSIQSLVHVLPVHLFLSFLCSNLLYRSFSIYFAYPVHWSITYIYIYILPIRLSIHVAIPIHCHTIWSWISSTLSQSTEAIPQMRWMRWMRWIPHASGMF